MSKRRKRRPRHSAAEYFVAALGVAMILGVIALAATARSCKVQPAPDFGLNPSRPTATPNR